MFVKVLASVKVWDNVALIRDILNFTIYKINVLDTHIYIVFVMCVVKFVLNTGKNDIFIYSFTDNMYLILWMEKEYAGIHVIYQIVLHSTID